MQSDAAPRPGIGAKFGLCEVARIEAHFGKVAARLTRRSLGHLQEPYPPAKSPIPQHIKQRTKRGVSIIQQRGTATCTYRPIPVLPPYSSAIIQFVS